MKLDIKSITFKNFRSYGNKACTIEFSEGLDLVTGGNGSGKTSGFAHALVYALYGVGLYGENVGDLVNRSNQSNMLVTLICGKDGVEYVISRGRNPDVRNILINGGCKEFEKVSEFNSWINSELLDGINLNTFCSLFIVQASNPAFSIFRMNKPARRELIEQLFDLSNFKKVFDLTKSEIKKSVEYNSKLAKIKLDSENKLNLMNKKVLEYSKCLDEFEKKRVLEINKLDSEIKELSSKYSNPEDGEKLVDKLALVEKELVYLNKVKVEINTVGNEYTSANNSCKDLRAKLDGVNKDIASLEISFKEYNELKTLWIKGNSLNPLKEDALNCDSLKSGFSCPLLSKFDNIDLERISKRLGVLGDVPSKLEKARGIRDNLKGQYDKSFELYKNLEARIKKFVEVFVSRDKLNEKINDLEKSKVDVNKELTELQVGLRSLKLKSETKEKLLSTPKPVMPFTKEEIEACNKELASNIELLNKSSDELKVYNELGDFLKKDTIKIHALRSVFPILKSSINSILKYFFDDRVRVEFDNDLEPVIYRGNLECAYSSFSGGEKKRLDIAFLFAIREFLARKSNINVNLLVLDELLDSELDEMGINACFEYLSSMSGYNVLLISHKLGNYPCKGKYIVSKDGRFSSMKYER